MTENTVDPFAINYDDVDGETAGDDSGGLVNKEGKYHMEVEEVEAKLETHKPPEEEGDKPEPVTPTIILKMVIVHSVEGQSPENVRYYHRIYLMGKGGEPLSDATKQRLIKQQVRLGLMKQDPKNTKLLVVASTGQRGYPKLEDYLALLGRQYIVQIDHEPERKDKNTGRTFQESWRCNWGNLWDINDPHVKDVPKAKDKAILAAAATVPVPATASAATGDLPKDF